MNPASLDKRVLEVWSAIQRALLYPAPRTLRFRYVDKDGFESDRHVEPYEIKGDKLWAFCLDREEIRQFFLESMYDVREGDVFRPRRSIVIPM